MKVSLIRHDPDALTLLLQTKNTRMRHQENPEDWSDEKRQEHLDYMRDTIKSSWEFVDYVFHIEGVSRAFTHQFVRTRTGSYAQQTHRAIDARGTDVIAPDGIKGTPLQEVWDRGVSNAMDFYGELIDAGAAIQDARGLLPTNVETAITAKFNLRTLHDMAKLRLCTRTQGEYQDVFRAMRAAVIAVDPWAAEFLEVHCVATGTCAFPRFGKKECPVYLPEMDNTAVREAARKVFWAVRHEAAPIAKAGKAM